MPQTVWEEAVASLAHSLAQRRRVTAHSVARLEETDPSFAERRLVRLVRKAIEVEVLGLGEPDDDLQELDTTQHQGRDIPERASQRRPLPGVGRGSESDTPEVARLAQRLSRLVSAAAGKCIARAEAPSAMGAIGDATGPANNNGSNSQPHPRRAYSSYARTRPAVTPGEITGDGRAAVASGKRRGMVDIDPELAAIDLSLEDLFADGDPGSSENGGFNGGRHDREGSLGGLSFSSVSSLSFGQLGPLDELAGIAQHLGSCGSPEPPMAVAETLSNQGSDAAMNMNTAAVFCPPSPARGAGVSPSSPMGGSAKGGSPAPARARKKLSHPRRARRLAALERLSQYSLADLTHSEHWPALRQGMRDALSDYDAENHLTGGEELVSGRASSSGSSSGGSGGSSSLGGCGDGDVATRVLAMHARLFVGAEHVQRAELLCSVATHLTVLAERFATARPYRTLALSRSVKGHRLAPLMALRGYRLLFEMQSQIARGFVYLQSAQLAEVFTSVMALLASPAANANANANPNGAGGNATVGSATGNSNATTAVSNTSSSAEGESPSAASGRPHPMHMLALADPTAQWFAAWSLGGPARAQLFEIAGRSGLVAVCAGIVGIPIGPEAERARASALPAHVVMDDLRMEGAAWSSDGWDGSRASGEPASAVPLGPVVPFADLEQLATLHALSILGRMSVYAQGRMTIAQRLGRPALDALTDLLVAQVAEPSPAPFKATCLSALIDRVRRCGTPPRGNGDDSNSTDNGNSGNLNKTTDKERSGPAATTTGSGTDSIGAQAPSHSTLEDYLESGIRPEHVVALANALGSVWTAQRASRGSSSVLGEPQRARKSKSFSAGTSGGGGGGGGGQGQQKPGQPGGPNNGASANTTSTGGSSSSHPAGPETSTLTSSCRLLSHLASSPVSMGLFLPPKCTSLAHGGTAASGKNGAPIDVYFRSVRVALEETCPGGAAWRPGGRRTLPALAIRAILGVYARLVRRPTFAAWTRPHGVHVVLCAMLRRTCAEISNDEPATQAGEATRAAARMYLGALTSLAWTPLGVHLLEKEAMVSCVIRRALRDTATGRGDEPKCVLAAVCAASVLGASRCIPSIRGHVFPVLGQSISSASSSSTSHPYASGGNGMAVQYERQPPLYDPDIGEPGDTDDRRVTPEYDDGGPWPSSWPPGSLFSHAVSPATLGASPHSVATATLVLGRGLAIALRSRSARRALNSHGLLTGRTLASLRLVRSLSTDPYALCHLSSAVNHADADQGYSLVNGGVASGIDNDNDNNTNGDNGNGGMDENILAGAEAKLWDALIVDESTVARQCVVLSSACLGGAETMRRLLAKARSGSFSRLLVLESFEPSPSRVGGAVYDSSFNHNHSSGNAVSSARDARLPPESPLYIVGLPVDPMECRYLPPKWASECLLEASGAATAAIDGGDDDTGEANGTVDSGAGIDPGGGVAAGDGGRHHSGQSGQPSLLDGVTAIPPLGKKMRGVASEDEVDAVCRELMEKVVSVPMSEATTREATRDLFEITLRAMGCLALAEDHLGARSLPFLLCPPPTRKSGQSPPYHPSQSQLSDLAQRMVLHVASLPSREGKSDGAGRSNTATGRRSAASAVVAMHERVMSQVHGLSSTNSNANNAKPSTTTSTAPGTESDDDPSASDTDDDRSSNHSPIPGTKSHSHHSDGFFVSHAGGVRNATDSSTVGSGGGSWGNGASSTVRFVPPPSGTERVFSPPERFTGDVRSVHGQSEHQRLDASPDELPLPRDRIPPGIDFTAMLAAAVVGPDACYGCYAPWAATMMAGCVSGGWWDGRGVISPPYVPIIPHLVEVILSKEETSLYATLMGSVAYLGGVVGRWSDPAQLLATLEWDVIARYLALVTARGADYLVYFPVAVFSRLAAGITGRGNGLAERLMGMRMGRRLGGRPLLDAGMLGHMDALRERYGGIVRREMAAMFDERD